MFVFWAFLNMGDPQVTFGFNTTSWSDDLDDLGYPHDNGNLHKLPQ